jgi:hypothetical protein
MSDLVKLESWHDNRDKQLRDIVGSVTASVVSVASRRLAVERPMMV